MGIRTKLGLKKSHTMSIDIDRYRVESVPQIPKLLHFIWVGDETKRPDRWVDTWREHHPDWEIRIWGNDDYASTKWRLKHHMELLWGRQFNGVADLMRYEILLRHGGIALDIDSICLRPTPDWILTCEAVAVASNEVAEPGLLGIGFLGSVSNNPFYEELVSRLEHDRFATYRRFLGIPYAQRAAWKSVGPRYFSRVFREMGYFNLTVLPSQFYYPDNKRGSWVYTGGGPVFGYQLWASTFQDYSPDLDQR